MTIHRSHYECVGCFFRWETYGSPGLSEQCPHCEMHGNWPLADEPAAESGPGADGAVPREVTWVDDEPGSGETDGALGDDD